MLVKGIIITCIQAVLLKNVLSQCIGPPLYPGEALYPANLPFVERFNMAGLEPAAPAFYGRVVGGNLIVDTSAPYAPTGPAGVSIFSDDLLIEGAVIVTGSLPFLGTVGLEGKVPTAGNSAVSYQCGTRNIGIDERIPTTGPVIPANGMGFPGGFAGYNGIGYGML